MKKLLAIIALFFLVGCTKETSIEQKKKDTAHTYKLTLKLTR